MLSKFIHLTQQQLDEIVPKCIHRKLVKTHTLCVLWKWRGRTQKNTSSRASFFLLAGIFYCETFASIFFCQQLEVVWTINRNGIGDEKQFNFTRMKRIFSDVSSLKNSFTSEIVMSHDVIVPRYSQWQQNRTKWNRKSNSILIFFIMRFISFLCHCPTARGMGWSKWITESFSLSAPRRWL